MTWTIRSCANEKRPQEAQELSSYKTHAGRKHKQRGEVLRRSPSQWSCTLSSGPLPAPSSSLSPNLGPKHSKETLSHDKCHHRIPWIHLTALPNELKDDSPHSHFIIHRDPRTAANCHRCRRGSPQCPSLLAFLPLDYLTWTPCTPWLGELL
jgi:hypothetical protein